MDNDKVRVNLYFKKDQYRILKSKLALEGKSVSGLLRTWIDKYLSNNTITQQHTAEQKPIEPPELNAETSQFNQGYIGIGKKGTKLKKKTSKQDKCPHLILLGGVCMPCGGLAKL